MRKSIITCLVAVALCVMAVQAFLAAAQVFGAGAIRYRHPWMIGQHD